MTQSERLLSTMRDVIRGWPLADLAKRPTFLRNLVFMHRVILASEHLLEVALQNCADDLRAYFMNHLEEERRHDEWLAEDLASAGVDIESCPFSPEAVAMAGAQYYLIYHVDPCALLGYMAVLECFPMPIEKLELLERAHGEQLCRTLRHHAVHDVEHAADLLAQVDRLTEKQFSLVEQNAVQTALYIGSAISKFEVQS